MLTQDQVLQERYQLRELLGSNAGRQTWLATDQTTQTPVVVKLLAFSPQMQWNDLKLFEREAEVLRQLNHPQIPRYRDYFAIDKEAGSGLCWFGLVQAYIPGASLQSLLHQGRRFSVEEVKEIAIQVLQILIYLHSLEPPLLHRDIKPSNLILQMAKADAGEAREAEGEGEAKGRKAQVYLVDFGAVQNQAAKEGMTFTVVGTTGYAPLEQFLGRAVPASDLYALGATLIHLLTGISPADLPQQNLRIQFSDRLSLDPTLVAWVSALTEPDLEQRYPTAAQALEDLQTGQSIRYCLQEVTSPTGSGWVKVGRSPQELKIALQGRKRFFLPDLLVYAIKSLLVLVGLGSYIPVALMILGLILGAVMSLSGGASALVILPLLLIVAKLISICASALGRNISYAMADIGKTPLPLWALSQDSLYANHHGIKLQRRLCGILVWQQWIPTVALKSVELAIPGSITLQTETLRQVEELCETVTVVIANPYRLGYRLTPTEANWLMQEIRAWLSQISY